MDAALSFVSVSIIMLLGKVVLCSPANEHYAHWLTSIMLIGKRVLCSLANEYYAHRQTSIMLTGKRILCSSANEYYAHWQTSIMLLLGDHLLPWLSLLYLRPFSLMNWNDRHLAESHPNKADCQKSCCLPRPLFLTSGNLGLHV